MNLDSQIRARDALLKTAGILFCAPTVIAGGKVGIAGLCKLTSTIASKIMADQSIAIELNKKSHELWTSVKKTAVRDLFFLAGLTAIFASEAIYSNIHKTNTIQLESKIESHKRAVQESNEKIQEHIRKLRQMTNLETVMQTGGVALAVVTLAPMVLVIGAEVALNPLDYLRHFNDNFRNLFE